MRMLKFVAALAFVAPLSPLFAAPGQVPAVVKPLTAEQWREDLRFMVREMKARHANLYHSISREDFDAMVASLDARIPGLKRNRIVVEMMRIAAAVHDGHTRIDPRKDKAFAFPSLPIKLYDFDDGIFIRAVGPGHEDLLGARLEAVGGVPVAEARARIEPLVSADNQMAARTMVSALPRDARHSRGARPLAGPRPRDADPFAGRQALDRHPRRRGSRPRLAARYRHLAGDPRRLGRRAQRAIAAVAAGAARAAPARRAARTLAGLCPAQPGHGLRRRDDRRLR